ncbi:DUF3757 domain-containing protein [Luteibacter flocculans]|uniref:DUF3757 domain-containing protein n=1 Tax=Luteibacter flocculans TaxID=2780091 RepID=A0ABY4T6S8_9GAMM|nr:DUF3757 domain-containing protein [Luteibacter flocculans]URL59055.1 DUF3757 domain-containing protein [Luteibacter flocculans]
MRMTTKRSVSIALVVALGLAGQAAAADLVCPAPNRITESEGSYGWDYTAKVGADTWEGSNPEGKSGDAKTFKLTEVTLRSGTFVACDYAGDGKAGVRLSLETKKQTTPVNAADWTNHCTVSGSKACAFRLEP